LLFKVLKVHEVLLVIPVKLVLQVSPVLRVNPERWVLKVKPVNEVTPVPLVETELTADQVN
jgi:hypothetical protein